MPGLIGLDGTTTKKDSLMPGAPDTAVANGTGYDPAQFNVDPAKQTVAGQLTSLLSSGNPYLEAARSGAMETANSRGLLNSSMAAGAGEKAAIDSALPVASADASTYNNAEGFNKTADNTALQFGANTQNTTSQFNAGTENQAGLIGTQTQAQKDIAQQTADIQTKQVLPAQTAAQKELTAATGEQQRQTLAQSGTQDIATQTLKGQQATDLAQIEAQYKTLIQSSAGASQAFQTTQATIANILGDANISAEQKQAAVNNEIALLQSGLAVQGSIGNLDLSGLLTFS